MNAHYEKQEAATRSLHRELAQFIDSLGSEQATQIQTLRSSAGSCFNKRLKTITISKLEIGQIKSDISENLEKIIDGMELSPFKMIIKEYKSKMQNFQELYDGLWREKM